MMSRKSRDKAETHQRVVDAASRQFRKHGYAGIGVAGVAKAAGVTTGALYDHFGSKDGAFAAALAAGLDEVIVAIPVFQKESGEAWVDAFVDYYLGRPHRADAECVCAMTSLSPEVTRAAPETKADYEAKMTRIVGLIAEGLPGEDDAERHGRAWRLLSVLIGALTLSRAVASEAVADTIADAAREAALAQAN